LAAPTVDARPRATPEGLVPFLLVLIPPSIAHKILWRVH